MAAYMGMRATQEFDQLAHNLANTSTTGFKSELLYLWRLDNPNQTDPSRQSPGSYLDVRARDFSQGNLHETRGEYDLALEGPGFFKVETPRGVRYTRNGAFRLNPDQQLVTVEGYPVLGKNGPILSNATDQKFIVDQEGGVHLDKTLGNQITVVNFADPQALLLQGNYYTATPQSGPETEATPGEYRVRQGQLEASNSDPIAGMIQMIDLQRKYESYLKVLDTFMDKDRKVVQEIGLTA
jgi:flagellar basal body rod protein FlgG